MRVGDAFPFALERSYPVVRPDYPLLTVLYLLRMRELDAVPLAPVKGRREDAVFGFTSLVRLLSLGSDRFVRLLNDPCSQAAEALPVVSADDEVESLLAAYSEKRLGFAVVRGAKKDGLVSLYDFIELYRARVATTGMKVKDVASDIFSLPPETTARDALKAMVRHHYRRVFLEGESAYVSDRDLMDHLFSPVTIDDLASRQRDPLARPLKALKHSHPVLISRDASLLDAARRLQGDHTKCLVTPSDQVVTAWDVVIKPWLSGRLSISRERRVQKARTSTPRRRRPSGGLPGPLHA